MLQRLPLPPLFPQRIVLLQWRDFNLTFCESWSALSKVVTKC